MTGDIEKRAKGSERREDSNRREDAVAVRILIAGSLKTDERTETSLRWTTTSAWPGVARK